MGKYLNPRGLAILDALDAVAAATRSKPAEVALAWLLAKPTVTAPIVGTTKLEHLETALRALELTLTAEEVRTLEEPYRPHAVRGH